MIRPGRRAVLLGALGLALTLGGVPGRADSVSEEAERLQNSIIGAEELGNFSRVQALRLKLAEWYADHARYAEAARQYELLLAARPPKKERVRYFTRLGDMLSQLGDWSRAIAAYGDALHDDPDDWDASLSRARAYTHVELTAQALQQYKTCIRIRPKRPESYAEIGAIYQKLGYLNKAIENYRHSLKLERQPDLYLAIADCYLREGDVARASAELQLAKAQLPQAEYDVRLGDIDRKQGDLGKAAAAWQDVVRSEPARDDVRLKLALVLDEMHRTAEANRQMRQLLDAYPQSPLVHYLHAWILCRQGDRTGARAETRLVAQLHPTEIVQHYNDRLQKELNP